MKLSDAQMRVLERMAKGEEVWTLTGLNPSAFWHGHIRDRRPNFSTLHRLKAAGFIEAYAKDWRGAQYRITDAGRSAVTRPSQNSEAK